MITIRRTTVQDADSISFLGKKTFEESYGEFFEDLSTLQNYLNLAFNSDKIKNSLQKPENLYWLVSDTKNSVPIGYAKLKLKSPSEFINDQNTCKLQRIYLRHGYEGQGIGTKLHSNILQEATKRGYKHMWLSNLKVKKQAVAFYKRNNYTVVGEHPYTIGEQEFDFWVMSIELT